MRWRIRLDEGSTIHHVSSGHNLWKLLIVPEIHRRAMDRFRFVCSTRWEYGDWPLECTRRNDLIARNNGKRVHACACGDRGSGSGGDDGVSYFLPFFNIFLSRSFGLFVSPFVKQHWNEYLVVGVCLVWHRHTMHFHPKSFFFQSFLASFSLTFYVNCVMSFFLIISDDLIA